MKIAMVLSTVAAIMKARSGSERAADGLANALSELGHEIYITNLLNRSVRWGEDFDVLHCINAGGPKGPYLNAIQTARRQNIPVVTSPIYWHINQQMAEEDTVLDRTATGQAEWAAVLREWKKQTRLLFMESDLLLPNAEREMEAVVELLQDDPELVSGYGQIPPYAVIPNAVDIENEILPVERGEEKLPKELELKLAERFILCVGRIEVRKNQSRLVEAMKRIWEKDPHLQLVLVGRASTPYIQKHSGLWQGWPILVHDETTPRRVLELMRRCTAYAQPSLLETPGLATLEAAALGKPIVSGTCATEEEYFGEHAHYCDPMSVDSIHRALLDAIAEAEDSPEVLSPSMQERATHIRQRYNYKRAGELLEEQYRRAIATVHSGGGE